MTTWTERVRRDEVTDAALWATLVAAGLALTALAIRLDLQVGTAAAPFAGRYRLAVRPATLLAPIVAVAVLVAVRQRWTDRLAWRPLLATGYTAALAWTLALALVDGGAGIAGPVTSPDEYLADLPAVTGPVDFVRTFTDRVDGYSAATRTHPPAPLLLLWLLHRAGLTSPLALGVVLAAIGCLTVPLVAAAVRSVCHEPAARRLVPLLVLAPYAVWVAVSMDAVTMTLAAASVMCGVVASEPGRPARWAVAAGLLLGLAALFSYSAAWLAVTPLVVFFVRRRVLLIAVMGVAALLPLAAARAAGFVWPEGLTAAQADWSVRVGPHRSWLLWAALDVVVLLLACGPAVVSAARRVRRTPGWPFLVGAGLAVVFAVGSGLARGEVERSWLPFFPWLLVPVVAPDVRPPAGAAAEYTASPLPRLLLALSAATAIVVEAVLRTTW